MTLQDKRIRYDYSAVLKVYYFLRDYNDTKIPPYNLISKKINVPAFRISRIINLLEDLNVLQIDFITSKTKYYKIK
jgi:hypothetical protein